MIGPARKPGEQAKREAKSADKFQQADDPGPKQAVVEADAFEEAGRALDVAEQDLVAVPGERAAGDEADQQLGERREERVERAERGDQKFG